MRAAARARSAALAAALLCALPARADFYVWHGTDVGSTTACWQPQSTRSLAVAACMAPLQSYWDGAGGCGTLYVFSDTYASGYGDSAVTFKCPSNSWTSSAYTIKATAIAASAPEGAASGSEAASLAAIATALQNMDTAPADLEAYYSDLYEMFGLGLVGLALIAAVRVAFQPLLKDY